MFRTPLPVVDVVVVVVRIAKANTYNRIHPHISKALEEVKGDGVDYIHIQTAKGNLSV